VRSAPPKSRISFSFVIWAFIAVSLAKTQNPARGATEAMRFSY
jgi:hypothetical protein